MSKLHIISEVDAIAIFRNKAEQCGLSSIRNINTKVHCTAVCVALIGTSENYFVWTKWNGKNISRSETGRTFSAKVRLIMGKTFLTLETGISANFDVRRNVAPPWRVWQAHSGSNSPVTSQNGVFMVSGTQSNKVFIVRIVSLHIWLWRHNANAIFPMWWFCLLFTSVVCFVKNFTSWQHNNLSMISYGPFVADHDSPKFKGYYFWNGFKVYGLICLSILAYWYAGRYLYIRS